MSAGRNGFSWGHIASSLETGAQGFVMRERQQQACQEDNRKYLVEILWGYANEGRRWSFGKKSQIIDIPSGV